MKRLKIVVSSFLLSTFLLASASAIVMENGVDPENLGRGQWIYVLAQATNRLGGNVESVTDVPSLMRFYKKSGIDFVVVKSGTGAREFPDGRPQFTRELVEAAHAEGLKIFGYTRSHGVDVPGEIALAIRDYELGADGYVIDAEEEWESHKLQNAHQKALDLCKGIKERYPNRFLGHAPFPIISSHRSFPYKEFGLYCDAVMPQAYWKSIKVSPTRMVEWMNQEWDAWHRSLPADFKGAIKPIAPIGQGWSPDAQRVLHPDEILEFVEALNRCPKPAHPSGYKGVSYWRTDLHTAGMWRAIRQAKIDQPKQTNPAQPRKAQGKAAGEQRTIPPAKSAGSIEIVLDNADEGVSFAGNWYPGLGKGHGPDYLCANTKQNGESSATAVFRPDIRKAGLYDVYVWFVPHANRSEKAPWFISYLGGSQIVPIDQTTGGKGWHLIASDLPFAKGTDGFLSISNDTGERQKVIIADAVRLVWKSDLSGTLPNQGN
ncbi:MAG: hypothetical protein ACK4UN_07765 [Limisphaerales bacterium]